MKRQLAVAAAVLVASLAQASAADIARPVYKAPAMAPMFSWTGLYAGFNAGYGFANQNSIGTSGQLPINAATVADGARPGSVGIKPDGFIGGAQIGYNWQTGGLVYGLEADIQYTDFKETVNAVTVGTAFPGTRNNVFTQELEYLGTVRARIGAAWDRTLVYATGGLAYGGVNHSANFSGPLPAGVSQFTGSSNKVEVGYTIGAGIEHAFAPNWSVKAEYLYYDLGDTSVAVNLVPGSGGVGSGYNSSFENTGHIVRAGLNYRFGY